MLAESILYKEKEEIKVLDFKNYIESCDLEISQFLNNDFNTPGVFSIIFNLVRKFNLLAVNKKSNSELAYISNLFISLIKKYGNILGLFNESVSKYLSELNLLLLKNRKVSVSKLNKLIDKRNNARKEKDYLLSDQIRDEILELGIEIKDTQDGLTQWSVKVDFKKS